MPRDIRLTYPDTKMVDMRAIIFGASSVVSDVLNGKRSISKPTTELRPQCLPSPSAPSVMTSL